MPIPLIILAIVEILEIVAVAATAHELLTEMEDIYEDYRKFRGDLEGAKKALRDLIDKLKQEIESKVNEKEEVLFLVGLSKADPQGSKTRVAQDRGAHVPIVKAAIEEKIPFRRIISTVCDYANRLPVPGVRKKKGSKLSPTDLLNLKKKTLKKLFNLTVEELAGAELDELIVVRMRQLMVSLIFEFIDKMLDWQSPMKAEVSFGPPPSYEDHPVGDKPTRLRRDGAIDLNPFFPGPYYRRPRSQTADLIITERRRRRCDKNNIFALVEIKFPGDTLDREQFQRYRKVLDHAADVKTDHAPVRYEHRHVNSGGRLSLFRYPEDKAAEHSSDGDKKSRPERRRKSGR